MEMIAGGFPTFFDESCLPSTMLVADQFRPVLEPLLKHLPGDWDYYDKILVFIAPGYLRMVHRYYKDHDAALIDMVSSGRLNRLDCDLCRKIGALISRIAPNLARWLVTASAQPV